MEDEPCVLISQQGGFPNYELSDHTRSACGESATYPDSEPMSAVGSRSDRRTSIFCAANPFVICRIRKQLAQKRVVQGVA